MQKIIVSTIAPTIRTATTTPATTIPAISASESPSSVGGGDTRTISVTVNPAAAIWSLCCYRELHYIWMSSQKCIACVVAIKKMLHGIYGYGTE